MHRGFTWGLVVGFLSSTALFGLLGMLFVFLTGQLT